MAILDRLDKRRVLWIQRVSGTLTVVKVQRITPFTDKVTYRVKTHILDIRRPAFRKKSTFYYVVDYLNGQLHFGSATNEVSAELIDLVLNKSICKQLVSGLERQTLMGSIMYILLALGMGIPLGYILGLVIPV